MNAPSPALGFNLTLDRFDAYVAGALASTAATRHMRDRLIAEARQGRVDRLLPKRLLALDALPDETNLRAAINVIDFWFEPIVMPTMTVAQAAAYFQAVETSLRFGDLGALDGGGPLWVDTVHHVCVFSVMHQFAAVLGQRFQRRHVVLLHQGQRPEPRLGIVANVLAQVHGVRLELVKLEGSWFRALARSVTPDTAIFYLTDLPPEAFRRRSAPRDRSMSQTRLYAEPDVSLGLDTISGSSVFARRLGARHVALDYPEPDRVRIRPYDSVEPAALCPLEDWAFWPLLARPRVEAPLWVSLTAPARVNDPHPDEADPTSRPAPLFPSVRYEFSRRQSAWFAHGKGGPREGVEA